MTRDQFPIVCVLDEDAASFAALLAHEGIVTAGPEAPIWLAQPDLAAAELGRGTNTPDWIQSTWAGVRPLVAVAAERGITLTGLKGIFAPLISEYVFARLLYRAADVERYRDAQRQSEWDATWPSTLSTQRICVIGTGSIGSHVARTARHFGMHTTGVSRNARENDAFDTVYAADEITNAVSQAQVVVATLPDTDATRNLIGAYVFASAPQNAWFFNVGRAATVDHDALADALERRTIDRATIDLTPVEPLPPNDPLWRVPHLEITPHIAAVSHPAQVVTKFIGNLERFRNGQPLADVVDLDAGY